MRIATWAATSLALLSIPSTASAKGPLKLEPSSVWAMNYAEDSCRLIRLFGQGDEQIRLELRMFAPGSSPWLLVSGEPIGKSGMGSALVKYRFVPDEKDNVSFAFRGELEGGVPAIMFSASLATFEAQLAAQNAYYSDRDAWTIARREYDPVREAQIESLAIDISRGKRITLELGSMHAPMDAMRMCLDDLLAGWGVDAKVLGSNGDGTPPIPTNNPGKWISSSDYPRRMLQEERGDKVDFRLTVDEEGNPTECSILTMEARSEFTDATCEVLMRQAHFKPAKDSSGKPISSIYVNSVRFVIR